MITENGIVVKTGAKTAWVKTIKSGACAGCSMHGSCEGSREGEVEALNTAGAAEGDTVVIGFESGAFIKISVLLYLFPVFCMIAGAIIGSKLAVGNGYDETTMSVICSFGAFLFSFICIRFANIFISGNDSFQAKVVRVRKGPLPNIACDKKAA